MDFRSVGTLDFWTLGTSDFLMLGFLVVVCFLAFAFVFVFLVCCLLVVFGFWYTCLASSVLLRVTKNESDFRCTDKAAFADY